MLLPLSPLALIPSVCLVLLGLVLNSGRWSSTQPWPWEGLQQ